MNDVLAKIRRELKKRADKKTRESGERFFKEKVTFYGLKMLVVNQIGREHWKEIQNKSKKEIFEWCEDLWKSGYIEEAFIACHWSYCLRQQFEKRDFFIFEKWVKKYVSNWATCDTLCNHTIGTLVETYPETLTNLKKWGKSNNRWMKRASAVTLIIPARKGKFLKDVFEIADILLLDGDDLVQKGNGWMLKAASEAHQKEVFDYVLKHKKEMPRTALRYAIEKMPLGMKVKAMER